MTKLELSKSDSEFFKTGQRAFRMGIDISGCMYRDKQRLLWEKGWKIAKKQFYDKRGIR
jgi:hypothetical protein